MRPVWENQGALRLVNPVNPISLQSCPWPSTHQLRRYAESWESLPVEPCCAGAKAPKAHRHALPINSFSSSVCIGSLDLQAPRMFCGTERRPSRHGLRHSGSTPMPSERSVGLRSEQSKSSTPAPLGNTEQGNIEGCANNLRGLAFAEAGAKPPSFLSLKLTHAGHCFSETNPGAVRADHAPGALCLSRSPRRIPPQAWLHQSECSARRSRK